MSYEDRRLIMQMFLAFCIIIQICVVVYGLVTIAS